MNKKTVYVVETYEIAAVSKSLTGAIKFLCENGYQVPSYKTIAKALKEHQGWALAKGDDIKCRIIKTELLK